MSGHSLSDDADGTPTGFLKTACFINAGHYPCGQPNGWSSRQSYWAAANQCIGGGSAAGSAGSPPPPPPPSSGGCDCTKLSTCLEYSGGSACFVQQNCQSIEAEVSNCQQYGGGAACVQKYCQTDSNAEQENRAPKKKLSAGDGVGIAVAVLAVLAIALLVGLVVVKHKEGHGSMPMSKYVRLRSVRDHPVRSSDGQDGDLSDDM
jgi:hypothetical protein